MTPVCPPNWTCTFTPKPSPPIHTFHPWWEGLAGLLCAGTAMIIVAFLIFLVTETVAKAAQVRRQEKDAVAARERDIQIEHDRQQHELDMAEQLTMQLDAAKGDPKLLELIKEIQNPQLKRNRVHFEGRG